MGYLTENSLYVEGVHGEVVSGAAPVDGVSTGLEKSPGQTGFFVHCQEAYALWLREASTGTWTQVQLFDAASLVDSTTYEWGTKDSLYVQSFSADQKVYIYPRTGPLYIDGDTSDGVNAHDTVVLDGLQQAVTAGSPISNGINNGSLAVISTDPAETAFRVSTSTDDNFFVIDESGSYDGRARVMVQTTNDFDASDVPYLGYGRGLVHIEREADDTQCALSIWSHGGTHSDNSGVNLVSWASNDNVGSYLNFLSNDGTFPSGYVPDTKMLGKISFGGYTNNQHRTGAHITSRATQAWHYGNKLGTKIILSTTPNDTNVAADHLTVSSAGIVLHAPASAIDSAELNNSSMCMSLDEATNKLTITVKYSDGTVKTGLVDLL